MMQNALIIKEQTDRFDYIKVEITKHYNKDKR